MAFGPPANDILVRLRSVLKEAGSYRYDAKRDVACRDGEAAPYIDGFERLVQDLGHTLGERCPNWLGCSDCVDVPPFQVTCPQCREVFALRFDDSNFRDWTPPDDSVAEVVAQATVTAALSWNGDTIDRLTVTVVCPTCDLTEKL